MTSMKLDVTKNGHAVYYDSLYSNVAYHLLETPDLIELVCEALPDISVTGETQVVVEKDMGRIVGTTNLVETDESDDIIYAKRVGRDAYSRFAKGRAPQPCSTIVIVLRLKDGVYYLWTAMCGRLLPNEAYDPGSEFNKTHALAFDERLVQADTIRTDRPLI